MALLDLPPELLTEIARQLGAKELRKSAQYLLVSKPWYKAALPIYLSNLDLSTLYFSSYDLDRLPPPSTPLSNLIAEKAERFSVRLIGHPSKQIATDPWIRRGHADDAESDEDEAEDDTWDLWMTVGPVEAKKLEPGPGRKSYVWHTEEHQLRPWRSRVNKKLLDLSEILSSCSALQDFSLEASSEEDAALGPRWDYLLGSSMNAIISTLPIGLKNLTLDTCGSALAMSKQDRTPMHICPLIALRLQDFENVRIRMRHICPRILDNSTNLTDVPSKLKTLIIRLSIPAFPEAKYEHHTGRAEYSSEVCQSYTGSSRQRSLDSRMIRAGISFARRMKLDMMRITYRSDHSSICLNVADCVRGVRLWEPSEMFCYEDDGRAWDGWEENDVSLRTASPLIGQRWW